MANPFPDPNFDTGVGWTFAAWSGLTSTDPPSKPYPSPTTCLYISRFWSQNPFGFWIESNYPAWCVLTGANIGDDVEASFRYNPADAYSPDSTLVIEIDYGIGGGWEEALVLRHGVGNDYWNGDNWWYTATIPKFRVVSATTKVRFIVAGPRHPSWSGTIYYIDSIDAEALVLDKSTADDFMDNLKTEIEGVDLNIGSVFKTKKKWKRIDDLKTDSTLTISTDGLFDTGRSGKNVTRFWMMDPQIRPRPLTNGSYEFESVITITGFFQREDADTQEEALFTAAMEIINRLCSRTVELTNLRTGDGYMGYLEDPPRVLSPVVNAQLDDSGILGHAIQLEVTFFEEVDR